MFKALAVTLLIIPILTNAEPRYKDGLQYAIDLAYRLDLPTNDLVQVFKQNRQNLPKEKDQDAIAAGIAAMAKVASSACSYSADLNEGTLSLKDTYQLILGRDPDEQEMSNLILDERTQQFSYFATCLVLAMSPEMIEIPYDGEIEVRSEKY